jgi:hypothetical protein
MESVRASAAAASVGNESKLKDHLHTLLGLGFGIQDHIPSLVRIADHSRAIVGLLRELHSPDPGACGLRVTASVVETRRYQYHLGELQDTDCIRFLALKFRSRRLCQVECI